VSLAQISYKYLPGADKHDTDVNGTVAMAVVRPFINESIATVTIAPRPNDTMSLAVARPGFLGAVSTTTITETTYTVTKTSTFTEDPETYYEECESGPESVEFIGERANAD